MLFSNNIFASNKPADKYSAIPNFSLVNEPDLTNILKAEILVHKDEQLRAAHLILSYNPILSNFQVPKYVIKAKDHRLHLINIAIPGFLNLDPTLEGVQQVELRFWYTAEEEEDEVVEVLDSKDDFEVFNQPQSPEVPNGDFSRLPLT